MARFLNNTEIINESKKRNRKIDVRVSIDWFNDGTFETIESASDEFLKLDLDRTLEGEIGTSVMDRGILVLDNSNNDYSPKSIASRFNVEIQTDVYEFNLIPNRTVIIELSINGSDYVTYYMGIISNISANYDNSRVSIDIEDEMITLQGEPARDYMFVETPVKQVISTLLEDSAIDYNPDLIDDPPYIINYNFGENTIYQALRMIAEMSWAKFFVIDGELHFVDLQNLDETNTPTIDSLYDEDFLQDGYDEEYSADELYTKATVKSNPYKAGEREIIWSGTESKANSSENYSEEDIVSNTLQLTYTDTSGETKDTNNVPIIEGSLTVQFGGKSYSVGYGLDSVDYLTGEIVFTNSEDYPLPNVGENLIVNYSYYLLSLPPAQGGEPYEKEIIANHEFPSIEVSNPNDYVQFEAVNSSKEYQPSIYTDNFDDITYQDNGGSGTVTKWTNTITLDENAMNLTITGRFDNSAYSHRFAIFGGKRKDVDSQVDLYVNGSFHSTIHDTTKFGWSDINSGKIAAGVTGGDEIQLKATMNRSCNKGSTLKLRDMKVNISAPTFEQETGEVGRVEIVPEYINQNKTRLIFRNYGDSEVTMYSTYNGKKLNNIYLTGIPLKQESPITKVFEDDDAAQAFSLSGNELTIDNNLIYDNNRAARTAQFLVDYYSTPRSVITVPIKGRPHYGLLDKLEVVREEADIDNFFLINEISDSFTEDGEWNQVLTLRQARSSAWQYTDQGGNNIIDKPSDDGRLPSDRPNPVTNLSLSLENINAGNSGYPSIRVNYIGNKNTNYYNIYLRKGVEGSWEFIDRTEEETFLVTDIYGRGEYFIKVVGVTDNGVPSDFANSPIESIQYFGAELILTSDIDLREVVREVQKGSYVSFIEVRVNSELGDFVEEIEIYYKHEDDLEWTLDGRTDRLFYEILASRLGFYEVKVIPKDIRGNKPNFDDVDSVVIEVEGKTDKPGSVPFETIYWGADYIEMVWEPHPDDDFSRYEIRLDNLFGEDN